jgi:N-acetylmuramoyl-L-alanine amidase
MAIIILEKEKTFLALYLLGILFLLPLLFPNLLQTTLTGGRVQRDTILIDPGHGGVDGGTQDAQGHLEKNINLSIAVKIRDQLRQSGVNAVMTRVDDRELAPFESGRGGRHRRDLQARVEQAKITKALFLVSIHCDWSTDPKRRGMVAFYYHRDQVGKNLALILQEELNNIQAPPKKAAPGKYYLIEQPGVTGVIIEVGFLSHPEEAALLQQADYQEKIALAVTRGILQALASLPSDR